MQFHDNCGLAVALSEEGRRAEGTEAGGRMSVFSAVPIQPGHAIHLEVKTTGTYGYLTLGVTGSEPETYNPKDHVSELPRTWLLSTLGDLYLGEEETLGVCPEWDVTRGDRLSILWTPPVVCLYHNSTVLYQWDTEIQGPAWLAANLWRGITLTVLDQGECHKGDTTIVACSYSNENPTPNSISSQHAYSFDQPFAAVEDMDSLSTEVSRIQLS